MPVRGRRHWMTGVYLDNGIRKGTHHFADLSLPETNFLFASWRAALTQLQRAIQRLENAATWAMGMHIPPFGKRYFIDTHRMGLVLQRLKKTEQGLREVEVRISEEPEKLNAAGYVDSLQSFVKTDWIDTYGAWYEPGEIHIAERLFLRAAKREEEYMRLLVVTIIHEATHKFLGTRDYSYFTNDGRNPRRERFDDPDEARGNADSLAWFAYHVGRPQFLPLTAVYP